MALTRVGLIACSAKKGPSATAARHLYTSPLFTKSLSVASTTCERAFVLSAHYGLVDLDRVIEPYNVTLGSFGKRDRLTWGRLIVMSLAKHYAGQHVHFHLFAGRLYIDPIVAVVAGMEGRGGVDGWTFVDVLEGLEIGERLARLNGMIKEQAG